MDILNGFDFTIKNSAVSLGKFDGIHQGHRLLLEQIRKQTNLVSTVFTFDGIQGNGVIPRQQIYSRREREEILKELGIQRELVFPFNEETRNITAESFLEDILVRRIDARYICVGEDFHFGKGREGNVDMLRRYEKKYGYQLLALPKLQWEGENVSSTRIRWELSCGRLDQVNALLGAPYFIIGTVVHGNALGRTLGMPTANLVPDPGKVLPAYGVYATLVRIGDETYAGVTNIGLKPTVGAENVTVETTLLDFDGDLYGREITVYFYHFLRREQKFSGLEELTRQMEQDRDQAREWMGQVLYKWKG